MADELSSDLDWSKELEEALLQECDFGSLRNICKGRPVPEKHRANVWQICLQVQGKGNSLAAFDGFFDLKEQSLIREDCAQLVDKLGNDEDEKVSVVADLESMVTFFCKSRQEAYSSDNGWLDLMQPLLALKLNKSDIYNCFYALNNKYITRDCEKNGKPFHLFRLLLQYHDPELCSFLDTKRITPDIYARSWFRSLFACVCDLRVIQVMWDVYLQSSDPFLGFFMALVILVNAREQILEAENRDKQFIVELISSFPSALEAEDIEDFCTLAQYYASKTPQSFRRDYEKPLFGSNLGTTRANEEINTQLSQMLCLPVGASELLQINNMAGGDGVRYFVVDCRPADQYNSGHLQTAMHLDANLMLQNPEEFNTAVQALFSAQQQAILAGSAAGGEHLCFVGSGRDEEDQYVNMVVANFLQKHQQYVSMARGGYAALHNLLGSHINEGMVDHNPKQCIVCVPEIGNLSDAENGEVFRNTVEGATGDSLFGRLSSVVKSKSSEMKEKLSNYIKNEMNVEERHVSNTDRLGKRYRNMASVFTIGDDEEGEDFVEQSDDEKREVISLDTWLKKPEIVYSCQCRDLDNNGFLHPSYLLVMDTHLYILREIPKKKGMAIIQSRRALASIVKITSKKKHPDLITFSYGTNEDTGVRITNRDRCLIPTAGEATKIVKQQIMKVLDALES
ncbi:TBC1 domain family member 23-like isoform X2 [Dreissena polymorpha]|uniref:TBC1 domain family member 23-like isoform X2 n=1 Tax=Dreissena polymorpha TaxID=45954 RepID=UPI00226518D0|nr:TBC1 domain family member 23-like isoform X2 [Dreissena polymorpha]